MSPALRVLRGGALLLGISAGLIAAAWYWQAAWAPWLVSRMLAGSAIQLQSLEFSRQSALPIEIQAFSAVTPAGLVTARNLSLHQLAPFKNRWRVVIGALQITQDPAEDSAFDEGLTLTSAWQRLQQNLGRLPAQGQINQVHYCTPDCVSLKVNWQQHHNGLQVHANVPSLALHSRLHIQPQRMDLTMTRNLPAIPTQAAPQTQTQPTARMDWAARLPAAFELAGNFIVKHNNDVEIQLTQSARDSRRQTLVFNDTQLSFMLQHLTLDARLTVAGTRQPSLTALLAGGTGHININGILAWDAEHNDVIVHSEQSTQSLQLDLTEGHLKARHLGDMTIDFTRPPLVGSWQVTGGSVCELIPAFSCRVAPSQVTASGPDNLVAAFNLPMLSAAQTSAGLALNASLEKIQLQNNYLAMTGAGQLTVIADPAEPASSNMNFEGRFNDLLLKSLNIVLAGSAQITAADPAQPGVNANIILDKIFIKPQNLLASATANVNLSNNTLTLHSNDLRLAGGPVTQVTASHSLKALTGNLQLSQSAPSKALQPTLDALVTQAPKVHAGSFRASAEIGWNLHDAADPVTSMAGELELRGLDISHQGINVQGLSFTGAAGGWPQIVTQQPATLTINALDMGLMVNDIRSQFDLRGDGPNTNAVMLGRQFSAKVLGGEIQSSDFRLNQQLDGFMLLSVKRIALAEVLALERDDFDSSGHLSGSVPVQITGGIVTLSEGLVSAEVPGGYIRYQPDPTTRQRLLQSKETRVILDTMADFHYHSLQAELNYGADGGLLAVTRIKGRNPAYEGGRDINVNLTLEENLGTLLRSLRIGDEVTRKLEQKSTRTRD